MGVVRVNRSADTNRAKYWPLLQVIAGVMVLASAVLLRMNTHEAHCHYTPEGRVCSVAWGK